MPNSKSSRWGEAEAVFHRAVELNESDRANYIRTACQGDEDLVKEVYSMLSSYESPDSFLEDTLFLGGFHILQAQSEQRLVGKRLGRYEIIKLIGTGGMGEVFLAHDVLLDRRVAIKLLPTLLTDDASRVRRFEQEAHTASTISHPNIAHIYEIGVDGVYHFTTMEFVEGLTLRQILNQRRLNVAEALEIAVQICSALVAAHSSGVIHRDIKPENIMIRPDGYVKVLDFGLAKLDRLVESRNPRQTHVPTMVLTEPGLIVGSPAYMSPEQARGIDVDARTDIWSLGVVLYEMLCGWTPFQGATNMDLIAALLREEPAPISFSLRQPPPGLYKVLKRMLSKDRDQRYATSREAVKDLQNLLRDLKWYEKPDRMPRPFSRASLRYLERRVVAAVRVRNGIGIKAPIPLLITTTILGIALTFLVRSVNGPRDLPNNTVSIDHYRKGVEAIFRDDLYAAARELQEVSQRKVSTDSLRAHARLAEVWAELDYSDLAKRELDQVAFLESDLNHSVNMTAVERYYAESADAAVARDFSRALNFHVRITQEVPTNADVWVDLGLSYERLLRWEEAANSYRHAIQIDQSKASAFFRLGMVAAANKKLDAATEAFERASELYKSTGDLDGFRQALFESGLLATKSGRAENATAFFHDIAASGRYDSFKLMRAAMELAIAFHSNDKQAKAREQNVRTIAEGVDRTGLFFSGPDQLLAEGFLAIGFLYLKDNDLLNAQKYFSEASKIAGRSNLKITNAKALYARGQQYLHEGLPELADRQFKEVLKIEIPDQNYLDQTVSMWRNTILDKDYQQALIDFKQVFKNYY